ncbi:aminotransferase class I/II-fold pyridoxal phosphate-dependent enzyme [Rhodobacterales bacterium LSUCC0031]|nr:aminotransferase class I/II-fold pyridoxal phosphate-dependent enzyme [Rhodobacterales bacterium LSUCC0031]
MFETVNPPELDKIIRLMGMFAADPREGKVDLGVGVYRSPEGKTPVMAAVKEAEHRIWAAQDSKTYVGLRGDLGFLDAMRRLLFGESVAPIRVAAAGTPGGTGAVRQVLETVHRLNPQATVWISDPTWPNHPAIIDHLGQRRQSYRYYDASTGGIDRDGMLADLAGAGRGDLILLHGCCHNPTGADLLPDDWQKIAAICARTGAIPFVDMAYQGFGLGLDEDAAGLRLLAESLPEVLIAASCSKNFGLYRERVGVVLIVTEGKAAAEGVLAGMNRQNFAFPPDHGARVVQEILGDEALGALWRGELEGMRRAMESNRRALAEALRVETGSDRFGFLAGHQGMFSLIGATPAQVDRLREDHGIYLVGDGRMNVAGLTPETIPRVARALAEVLA